MDKFAAMQAFARVVESGSFTKAADSLEIPNTAVTRLVKELETHLRTKLIHRTTRRLSVTPEGQAFYEGAIRLMNDWHSLEAGFTEAQGQPHGRLRVDVGSSVARQFLVPALPAFQARYPGIELCLGVSDQIADVIGQNVDCVIRGGDIADESLVARRLGTFNYLACATPAYLERHGMPEHPRDLETPGHTVLSYFSVQTGRLRPLRFSKDGQHIEVHGRSPLSLNESSAYLAAGLAGLGVMAAPAFALKTALGEGAVVRVLADWTCADPPAYIAYPAQRHMSQRLRVFVDWVVALFADEPLFQGAGERRPLPPASAPAARAKVSA